MSSPALVDTMSAVPPAILEDLRHRYAEPHRAYHTWRHVEELLALYGEVSGRLQCSQAVLFAILFHDAIYDPVQGDNEERSAHLLRRQAAALLNPQVMARALRLIRATEAHEVPRDLASEERSDAALFLDMDLAILGADPDRFDEYEEQVRSEYSHVPEDVFQSRRAEILRRFLARRPLYLSEWGQQRFARRALHNLHRAVANDSAS